MRWMQGASFEQRRTALIAKLRMLMMFQQGMSTRDIARALSEPESYVYNTLSSRQVPIKQAIENVRLSLKKQRQKEWRKAA